MDLKLNFKKVDCQQSCSRSEFDHLFYQTSNPSVIVEKLITAVCDFPELLSYLLLFDWNIIFFDCNINGKTDWKKVLTMLGISVVFLSKIHSCVVLV